MASCEANGTVITTTSAAAAAVGIGQRRAAQVRLPAVASARAACAAFAASREPMITA